MRPPIVDHCPSVKFMFLNGVKTRSLTPFQRQGAVDRKSNLLRSVFIVWGAFLAAIGLFLWLDGIFEGVGGNYYLIPWAFATGIVVLIPIIYQFIKGTFDPFHPLVFASWSYFFPGFAIGGLVLALGYSQPFYLSFVMDEHYNLPLTFLYVMLGFGGLTAGFIIPFAGHAGQRIAKRLPVWNWKPEQVLKPGLILLAIGLGNSALGFASGILGFQRIEEIGKFDGIIILFSMLWLLASFLLWLAIFRSEKLGVVHYAVIAILLISSISRSAYQGNRGGLVSVFMLIAFAYVCSGKKIGPRQTLAGGGLIVITLIVGMIYGTTFRAVKETSDRVDMDKYAGVIGDAVSTISDQDLVANLSTGFAALGERLDSISPLAVVVSNYEKLGPYEEAYGLSNNIVNDTVAFMIPRVIWEDKWLASDASKYGDLYFNFPNNSFTLTPMGDLLRNFGPWGVPLGVILLGFILRIIYTARRGDQPFSFWRAGLFYMLLSTVSYEGSYALIIPTFFKVGFIAVMGILLVRFIAGRGQADNPAEARA